MSSPAPPPPRRVAVVDIGSNSLHLQLAELPDGAPAALTGAERASVALGALDGGQISDAVLDEAAAALQAFARSATSRGYEPVVAVATAALREAGEQVAHRLSERSGVDVRVISGDEEAGLIYLGARRALRLDGAVLVIDLGGRSTELALGEHATPRHVASVPIGHLWARNHLRDHGEQSLRHAVLQRLLEVDLDPFLVRDHVVVTAGTALTLLSMAAAARGERPADRHGLRAARHEVEEVFRDWRAAPPEARAAAPGFDPRRLDTFEAGAIALLTVLDALGVPALISSQSALREGLVEHLRQR